MAFVVAGQPAWSPASLLSFSHNRSCTTENAVTTEYDTLMICRTLAAVPRRIAVLAAIASVLTATIVVAAAMTLTATLVTMRQFHGYAEELSIMDESMPWAGLGVLAAYAPTAIAIGTVLVHRRDA